MTELGQLITGWPALISMATAVAAQSLRAGRRRGALNEALHELRRPLQAVALALGSRSSGGRGEDSFELATFALDRLDREINGRPRLRSAWGKVDLEELAQTAVERWQAKARLAETAVALRWNAGPVHVQGDRCALGQALDNLIVNAIEHGGPTVIVSGRLRGERVRLAVVDSGCAARPAVRRAGAIRAIARLAADPRHGHGLAVVRRVAAAHGGRFALRQSERGSLAALELPLADSDPGLGRA